MKKKRIVLYLIILLVVIMVFLGVYFVRNKFGSKNKIYFENKQTIIAAEDILSKQKEADENINKLVDDKSYTLDNPKVLENPYYIAPLSALVIFQTKDEVSVKLTINGVEQTTYESSKKHLISIYGLKSDFENKVLLETSNGKKKELIIKTGKYEGGTFNVETKNVVNKDNFYFLSAPMGLGISAIDAEGSLVWYLTGDYNQDIEFLDNGHILVSNGESSGSEFGYTGFIEVDYLGKIYHNYVLEGGYHHEVVELKNHNLLVAGDTNDNDNASQDYIYTIDRETGKVLDSLNLYDYFASIDNTIESKIKGRDFINNSIDYNEDTDEMILSLRGLNSIISIQYKEKKLNWIFGSDTLWTGKFASYLLNITDNSRLPLGAHTAFKTSDGLLGVFNNDFDMYNESEETSLDNYKDNYSSATLYKITGKNIETVYDYVSEDKVFNYALGSFNITNDNHKLVDFGWSFKKEAYEKNLNIYDYFENTYSRITEIDESDNIVFNATIEQSIYRSFKHAFYKDNTANFIVSSYSLIDNIPFNDLESIDISTFKSELDNAEESGLSYDVTKNSLSINANFDILDDVTFYFVGKNGSYAFHYKPANKKATPLIHLDLSGEYVVYLKINDTMYDDKKVLEF